MRTALILLLVASVASFASWKRWHSIVSGSRPAYPRPTAADRNHGDPVPPAVARILDRPLPAGTRLEGRLIDAIDRLRATGLNVFVNWRALERAGVGRETPVSVDAGGVTTSEALSRLLAAAPPKGRPRPDALDFHVEDGVVTVSTADDLAGNTLTRVYDVRDLVGASAGTFPLVRAAAGATSPPPPPKSDPAKLARLVGKIQAIEPHTWRDNGGHAGSVRELQGQLIVTQTPWAQRVITYTVERERWRMRWWAFGVRAVPTVVLPVALVAAIRAFPWLRRRRARLAGRCERCGYDLRATPERCPECGATPERAGRRPPTPSPSPGAPGEGRDAGSSLIANQGSKIEDQGALTPALSRSTGRGSSALDALPGQTQSGFTQI